MHVVDTLDEPSSLHQTKDQACLEHDQVLPVLENGACQTERHQFDSTDKAYYKRETGKRLGTDRIANQINVNSKP